METVYLQCDGTEQDEEKIRLAGRLIRQGGLVAFPTETVYGLGGDALNPDSSRKIYAAKGRPSDNPLIVHICKWDDILSVTQKLPPEAKLLADKFWPGPLTMILQKSGRVPYETTGGLDTVAIRMPSHPAALRLIEESGGYVAAPSANLSGRPSPTNAKDVREDMAGRIEAVLDGGEVGIGIESTIVDLTVSPPQILRPGYITGEMLAETIGRICQDETMFEALPDKGPKAPGMKYRHYAPQGKLTIVKGEKEAVIAYINEQTAKAALDGKRTGVLAARETSDRYRADVVLCVGSRNHQEEVARHLYSMLREFDRQQAQVLFSEDFEAPGFGMAVTNRLLKAAGHCVVELQ